MKNFVVVNVLAIFLASAAYSTALIDPNLRAFARGETQSITTVLALVKGQSISNRPQRYDRQNVIRYYKEAARVGVQPLLVSLQNKQLSGVRVIEVYWINGAVLAEVTPQGLHNLAEQSIVTKIYKNNRTGRDRRPPGRPVFNGKESSKESGRGDYAFPSIGLDKLASEQSQINGRGVLVGLIDTGVDATHPALQGKIPIFYDGQKKAVAPPKEFDDARISNDGNGNNTYEGGHGTHVTGTVVGGPPGHNIGVAPGAKVVMAGAITLGYDEILEAMQWFLDAEKNSIVAQKIKVIGGSWTSEGAPDQEVFYRAIAAWESAGILPVFSAGNSGLGGITPPHEYPGAFAVGAYGANGIIANLSSRGPGHFRNQTTSKPDITAPGMEIISAYPGGLYAENFGTSMAQPHVTGTVALMLQVNPNLNPAQIREILLKTAVPGDNQTAGQWSPEYGFGKLNAYSAVKMVATLGPNGLNQGLNQFLGSVGWVSPRDLERESFDGATLGEVDGELDRYQGDDNSPWLTAAELFNL